MSLNPIDRARRYVAKCPAAVSGQRGHDATYRVASVLWNGFALSEADTLGLLREYSRRCVPPWSEAELVHKVRSTAGAQHPEPRGHLLGNGECGRPRAEWGTGGRLPAVVRPPKPVFRPMVLSRVAAKAGQVGDVVAFIAERSPVPVDAMSSGGFLRLLYPKGSGEKVVVFSEMRSQGQMLWKADAAKLVLEEDLPAGPEGVWFLAQPVDGKFYHNPRTGGRLSRRSEESVTAWRYVVLESDEADPDQWLRCLAQMPLRIASICESGGRSMHALVRVDAASKADWDAKVGAMKPVLVTLGADPGALSAVRLTRLPQAKRGERVQRLLYLNPEPDGRPIIEMGLAVGHGAECGDWNGGARHE